jgi:uncharacterized Zn finger protein
LTLDTSRTTGKLLYTLADVQRIFSAGEIAKGQAYFRDGLVLAVEIGADGTVLRGQVQGTLRRPYTATVHIQPQGGYGRSRYGTGTLLAGSCSCPVGYNCTVLCSTRHQIRVDDGMASSGFAAFG